MAGYSGTPLATKLGIKPGHTVLLDGVPDNWELETPPGVTQRRTGTGPFDVILAFCADRARLAERWATLHERTTKEGALWIAWPKKASGVPTDLNENVVRDFALANGRVDVKVCAIDETWSGLKHVIRLTDR
jgi:hypothetical protein